MYARLSSFVTNLKEDGLIVENLKLNKNCYLKSLWRFSAFPRHSLFLRNESDQLNCTFAISQKWMSRQVHGERANTRCSLREQIPDWIRQRGKAWPQTEMHGIPASSSRYAPRRRLTLVGARTRAHVCRSLQCGISKQFRGIPCNLDTLVHYDLYAKLIMRRYLKYSTLRSQAYEANYTNLFHAKLVNQVNAKLGMGCSYCPPRQNR